MRKLMITAAALLAATGVTSASVLAATPSDGSVKVALTSPRSYQGPTRPANITCAQSGTVYVVHFGRTTSGNTVITGALTIRGFSGPGSYTGRLAVGARGPAGTAGATVKAAHVSITDTGGEATFSRTLTGVRAPRVAGKVIAGTVDWTCAS
jgi:hypothetical protein